MRERNIFSHIRRAKPPRNWFDSSLLIPNLIKMHVLGLACGSINGNSEILLIAALEAAQQKVIGTTISLIRIQDLSIPSYPMHTAVNSRPQQPSDSIPSTQMPQDPLRDDRPWVLEAILRADAILISSPIYTRQPAGILKYFCDQTLGPLVDAAAHVSYIISAKETGDPRFVAVKPDTRVLKPRVAGLIAVGGASSQEWVSFGLPLLHQCVFSLHANVVDQMQVLGHPEPGSVLLRNGDEDWVARAEKLGERIASQLGMAYDDASYLGEEGTCFYCHLDMVMIRGTADNAADCAVCGARGRLVTNQDGRITLKVDEDNITSIVTMEGKERHLREINGLAKVLGPKMSAIQKEKEFVPEVARGASE